MDNSNSSDRFLKLPDVYICLLGLLSYSVGMLTIGLSSSISLVFISGVLGMGARVADSILRSLVSQVKKVVFVKCLTLLLYFGDFKTINPIF